MDFLGFGISLTTKNVFKPKKVSTNTFRIKIVHLIPALATPNEVDCVIQDW